MSGVLAECFRERRNVRDLDLDFKVKIKKLYTSQVVF
jgi:hypothetical protein